MIQHVRNRMLQHAKTTVHRTIHFNSIQFNSIIHALPFAYDKIRMNSEYALSISYNNSLTSSSLNASLARIVSSFASHLFTEVIPTKSCGARATFRNAEAKSASAGPTWSFALKSNFNVSKTVMKLCVASATYLTSFEFSFCPFPARSIVAGTPASTRRIALDALAPYVSKNPSKSQIPSPASAFRAISNFLSVSTHARSYSSSPNALRTYARSSFSNARASAYTCAQSSNRFFSFLFSAFDEAFDVIALCFTQMRARRPPRSRA